MSACESIVHVRSIPDLVVGIIEGTRLCLEHAVNRYTATVDHDDLLTPDCIRVVSHALGPAGYPALAYTDEDKLDGDRFSSPYFKPSFDPVLFANSCYIAHLSIVDRRLALQLGAYTDKQAEGSHDWDTFVRFLLAGHTPAHIPEVLYSWRMHPASTARQHPLEAVRLRLAAPRADQAPRGSVEGRTLSRGTSPLSAACLIGGCAGTRPTRVP